MKSIFSLLLLLPFTLHAEITETASQAVQNMGIGWNLGNTLDANGQQVTDVNNASYWGGQGIDSETYWGQPVTQSALFDMMRRAGFGAIRVPVTWYNHMDSEGNVKAEWMERVHQVVDYVIDNGLYCILNVHHDTGADGNSFKSWIKADKDVYDAQKTRYNKLWQQIAEEFKDYDQHLLFEAYNEMLDGKSSWCYATFSYPNQYDATYAARAYEAINNYAQDFVNTVRATGSNNASRNLIVNTYAASNGYGTWSSHLKEPLTQMKLPTDVIENRLIFEVHSYPAIANSNGSNRSLQDIKNEVNGMISTLKTNLVAKGAPVIFGEWGTSNVDSGAGKTDYDVRRDLMKQFIQYFVEQTKANGMGTFYWMGLTDGMYRSIPAFSQPDLAECMAKAYHGSSFEGEYPTPDAAQEVVCFEGEKAIGWGNGISISSAIFGTFDEQPVLELTYTRTGDSDDIQFFYGDWSAKVNSQVDGNSLTGDFSPSAYYGTPTGTQHTTTFQFDATTSASLRQRGLIIHGNDITLTKAVLRDPASADIQQLTLPASTDAPLYDLTGRRIHTPLRHGLYIQNGRLHHFSD